jgi:two-component system chemotaxis response regulator CheY
MDTKLVVLLIDEDASVRNRLAIRIEPMGFQVFQTDILEEAKVIVADKHPFLVVMEWGLKGHKGEDVFRELKVPATKVCVFTNIPHETFSAEAKLCGLKAVFQKNDRFELLEHIETLLKGKAAEETPVVEAEGLQVLVIDDSSAIRASVRMALRSKFPGCVIREAEDGRTALTEMSQKKVDLIITDLEMPGMDGREFLSRIQSNSLLRRKAIIVFSGNITQELCKTFEDLSNVRFLYKPCSPQQIVETAGKVLGVAKGPKI